MYDLSTHHPQHKFTSQLCSMATINSKRFFLPRFTTWESLLKAEIKMII